MGTFLFLILLALAIVQFIIYKRKQSKFNQSETQAKIQELLDSLKAGMTEHTDPQGRNILMIACCENGDVRKGERSFFDVIKQSVQSGIRVNTKSLGDGKTALAYAAAKPYNKDIVSYLIKAGADTSSKDASGRIPVFESAQSSDLDTFTEVANHTSSLNAKDNNGNTPLMVAAENMNIPIIRELISRNVNFKTVNKSGQTAYQVAEANKSRFFKYSQNSARPDEYGKHNHTIEEIVRQLHCLENDVPFKPRKYSPPSREGFGEDPGE